MTIILLCESSYLMYPFEQEVGGEVGGGREKLLGNLRT